MSSPAERFAAARIRQLDDHGSLGDFRKLLSFELDEFQLKACRALTSGKSVLVAAPTGAGKTIVGEYAIHLAVYSNLKAFYTTPIKALSNQKYAELVQAYGAERVGLLTGDTSINSEADIVVMTTEVLRNMIYAESSTLERLGFVVMDEVHYLADRFRGPVWEEVIIQLPDQVKLVSLSATVSNAEEFGDWLDTVRGDTEVIVEEHRPVPLYQHIFIDREIHDLFSSKKPGVLNPAVARLAVEERRREEIAHGARRGPGAKGRPTARRGPRRPEVIAQLDRAGLLPAITFIFSRAGCDGAVKQCLTADVRLTTPEQATKIRLFVQERTKDIPASDLQVLGYWEWMEGLTRGIAAHHAGLLPVFKEVVEALFTQGLVRCVFATETLALGINMPAKTVVLEKLVKWNGEAHVDLTAGEFTQLTGRAGRRGIDREGHAVVLWHSGLDPAAVAGLASTRMYPLKSSFRPTYNMAVNLVAQSGRQRAREILETSFAQFQADRAVVGLAKRARTNEQTLAEYSEAMSCHLGDFAQYAALRLELSELEKQLSRARQSNRRAEIALSLEQVQAGDVLRVQIGRRPQYVVVIQSDQSVDFDGPQPRVMGVDRQIRRLRSAELAEPVHTLTHIRFPKNFSERSPHSKRELALILKQASPTAHTAPGARSAAADHPDLGRLRRELRQHPCHGCSDREEHARWGQRWAKLRAETDLLGQRIESRTSSVARVFDRVCGVLTELEYLDANAKITDAGQGLRRLYTEHDLLVAQCLRTDAWVGLTGPELAACLAALVHETRREGESAAPAPAAVQGALLKTRELWRDLTERERAHGLATLREPDPGLCLAMHRWARGEELGIVLRDSDLAAGDFVRRCKQLIDLLGQIASASERPALRSAARSAAGAILRGVVDTAV